MNKFAKKPWLFPSILLIGVLAISSAFNKNQKTIWGQNLLDSLTDSQKRETQNSLKGLKIHPDLEITTSQQNLCCKILRTLTSIQKAEYGY